MTREQLKKAFKQIERLASHGLIANHNMMRVKRGEGESGGDYLPCYDERCIKCICDSFKNV